MRPFLLELIACPDCHRYPLTLDALETIQGRVNSGKLICTTCHREYPIQNGIPILLPGRLQDANSDKIPPGVSQKIAQAAFFDATGASDLEIDRPHHCGRVYNYLLQTKIDNVFELYGTPLKDKAILDVCCGAGMDAEFLCAAKANVVGIDLSFGALLGAQERARRYHLDYELVAGDVERLPFRGESFDITFVHDGLHHLDDPKAGFMEMARVARSAILVTEPSRSLATNIAVQFGAAQNIEEGGNQVYRFTPDELSSWGVEAGYSSMRFKKYAMYYRQKPFWFFNWFESPFLFSVFRSLFRGFNFLVGRWGNKIATVFEK